MENPFLFKWRGCLLAFSLLSSPFIQAQETTGFEVPNFAPKTPEAAAFLKYGEYPVDLSTGVPNISIPLYTIEDHGFSIPISLDYHASGIKVNQEATWVGLGWNLNFGAQIILSPRDGIDQNNQFIDILPDADSIIAHFNAHPYEFSGGPVQTDHLDMSRIKDVYNFSSPTTNGSFYIRNKDSSDVVIFPPDAFKVEIFYSSSQYLRFKITDTSGNIYFFDHTADKSLRTLTHNDFYTSAWYVDQIKTPNNNIIDFNYEEDGAINDYSFSQKIVIHDTGQNCSCGDGQHYDKTISGVINEGGTTITQTKKIESIVFNNGQSRVLFNKTAGRADLVDGNSSLSSIEIQQLEESVFTSEKGYTFEYSYFDSPEYNPTAYKIKRLKLDRILTLVEGEAHEFVYSDIDLPAKVSKAQDYYGYYNGHANIDLIPKHFIPAPYSVEVGHANRTVNPETLQAGMLKEIHYPTKGWTKFNYEPNQYFGVNALGKYDLITISHNMVQGTGVPEAAASTVMGPGIDDDLVCINPGPECVHYETVPITFNNSTGKMSFTVVKNDDTPHHYEYAKVRMFINGIVMNTASSSSLPTGTHTFEFANLSGSGYVLLEAYGSVMEISDFQLRYVNDDLSPKNVNGSGLRIKAIENYNHNNALVSVKAYDYSDATNALLSSGKLVNEKTVSFFNNYISNVSLVICPNETGSGAGGGLLFGANYDNSYSLTSNSRYGIEGNSVAYEYVKEKNVSVLDSTKTNGYTLYKFSTDPDLIPWGDPTVQIYSSWKRGKVLEKKIYKTSENSDFLLNDEINTYVEDNSKISYIDGFKMFRHGNLAVSENSLNPLIAPQPYIFLYGACYVPTDVKFFYEPINLHLPIAWFYLKNTETIEHFYDSSNVETGIVTTTKTFNYNNPLHQQLSSQVTSNSNDETIETKYYYPQDSAMSGEPYITDLIAKNMIAVPLKIESYNGSEKLAEKKTVYADDTSSNNLLLPKFVYTKKGTDTNATLEKKITYDKYDTDGRLLQYTVEDGN
ncbi:MAG TPA: hypothetical protein VK541_15855, partial [Pedobacter sp.]|uniref:hypothetical protein n=1 Tax=Pedobacter sp. TaxID=1411316 RepID=UPI002CB10A40